MKNPPEYPGLSLHFDGPREEPRRGALKPRQFCEEDIRDLDAKSFDHMIPQFYDHSSVGTLSTLTIDRLCWLFTHNGKDKLRERLLKEPSLAYRMRAASERLWYIIKELMGPDFVKDLDNTECCFICRYMRDSRGRNNRDIVLTYCRQYPDAHPYAPGGVGPWLAICAGHLMPRCVPVKERWRDLFDISCMSPVSNAVFTVVTTALSSRQVAYVRVWGGNRSSAYRIFKETFPQLHDLYVSPGRKRWAGELPLDYVEKAALCRSRRDPQSHLSAAVHQKCGPRPFDDDPESFLQEVCNYRRAASELEAADQVCQKDAASGNPAEALAAFVETRRKTLHRAFMLRKLWEYRNLPDRESLIDTAAKTCKFLMPGTWQSKLYWPQ